MGSDWTLEHLERELSVGFAFLGEAERSGELGSGESRALAEGVLRCMNGALQKVTESLEAQAGLRRELEALRCDRLKSERELRARIEALESQLLRRHERIDTAADRSSPDQGFLQLPLVMRTPQGEFLGVSDERGNRLTLAGFVRLVEWPAASGRSVGFVWERGVEGWTLVVSVLGPGVRCCHALSTRALLTPSGNRVVLLEGMSVDGRAVPREYVVQMFRQLRDGLQPN
jgi:hypothetical protein